MWWSLPKTRINVRRFCGVTTVVWRNWNLQNKPLKTKTYNRGAYMAGYGALAATRYEHTLTFMITKIRLHLPELKPKHRSAKKNEWFMIIKSTFCCNSIVIRIFNNMCSLSLRIFHTSPNPTGTYTALWPNQTCKALNVNSIQWAFIIFTILLDDPRQGLSLSLSSRLFSPP